MVMNQSEPTPSSGSPLSSAPEPSASERLAWGVLTLPPQSMRYKKAAELIAAHVAQQTAAARATLAQCEERLKIREDQLAYVTDIRDVLTAREADLTARLASATQQAATAEAIMHRLLSHACEVHKFSSWAGMIAYLDVKDSRDEAAEFLAAMSAQPTATPTAGRDAPALPAKE